METGTIAALRGLSSGLFPAGIQWKRRGPRGPVAAVPERGPESPERLELGTFVMSKSKKPDEGLENITRNRRAFHEYEIFDTLECGLVLVGTEVKSLRERAANLEDSYAKVEDGELWLINSDIPEYSMGNRLNHK